MQSMGELTEIYTSEYWKVFASEEAFDEGLKMVADWHARTEFGINKVVASTEVKESFPIKAAGLEIPFNYIWDRCDITTYDDGTFDVDVIDYKTVGQPISPEDLKKKIQARAYALAAAIKYPQARHIWVTYDLLRYDQVGTRFTREENVDTYRYLQGVVRRILDSKGTEENLNPECRWCIRKPVCNTLERHAQAGGILGITDPAQAADKRAKIEYAMKALAAMANELDEFLLKHLEEDGLPEFKTNETVVEVSISGRRHIDPKRVVRVIGPDLMAEYGDLKLGDFDRLLKDARLTNEQRSELRGLQTKKFGEPRIKVKPLMPLGEED